MVGRIPKADDYDLGNVRSEEVKGAWRRIGPYNSGLAIGVGNLLDAAGELRVAHPLRRVHRSAVHSLCPAGSEKLLSGNRFPEKIAFSAARE